MKRILVTGATGNIGKEVIHFLGEWNSEVEIIAGVRSIKGTREKFYPKANLHFCKFDFEDQKTFEPAFEDIDILFLLRPPQLSEVEKYFKPLLNSARDKGIRKLVFLSVQGAEKSKIIPHNKIERLIKSLGFDFIFVRPGYFMQNLTTTLQPELLESQSITLPAGKAKFNWIDVKNIGEATARLLLSFPKYQNKAYDITGKENKDFYEVTELMTDIIGVKFKYRSLNPISFYIKKRRAGVSNGFALVMTLLHFLPRFQKEPKISDNYKMLTGHESTSIKDFIAREQKKLAPSP